MSRMLRLTILAAAGALALATPAAAQQSVKREPIKPITEVSGAASFKQYCTVCHGTSARGDGPAAKALKMPPADLTQIAKRNGGKFPALAVRMSISGDTAVAAHGTRDMPTWGQVFHETEGDPVSALRVKNLVDYIEGMQAK